ncbi:MAG: hypothetical protein ABSB59_30690 [Streptosporangiaceae bacterium]
MNIIPIAILASDPITWEGSVALLSAHPDLLILPPELRSYARVLVVITPAVTEPVLREVERAQAAAAGRWLRIVMAADHLSPPDFLRASRAGLVRLLDRRQCGYDQIADAVKAADAMRPGAGWRTAAARNPRPADDPSGRFWP